MTTNSLGINTDFTYNPSGLRHSKTVDNTKTTHVWDGPDMIAETQKGTSSWYIRGYALLWSQEGTGTKSIYLFNAHGDVIGQVGAKTSSYAYDAFGNQLAADGTPVEWHELTGSDRNPFRYCGEYTDYETGYVYLRARYYDSGTGRFVSEDPIRDGVNWYGYCGGNPIAFVDPFGLVAVGLKEYAETYEGATVTVENNVVTVSWEGLSFSVHVSQLTNSEYDHFWCIDDSVFVNAFGVGTNTYIVYQDSTTGNVSIRAAFNISGSGADMYIQTGSVLFNGDELAIMSTYRALFLAGIEEAWSNNTTSVYARESSKGVKVNVIDGTGTSNVSNFFGGFVEAFWSPSNPGNVTMYTNSYSANDFKVVAAHEFGHILGIDDGYNNATYKYYNSIMCDQWGYRHGTYGKATSLDIEKALKAYKAEIFQKWN